MTNLARKAFHASGVVIVLVYLGTGMSRRLCGALLLLLTLLLALVDLARHRIPALQELFERRLRTILDPKDRRGLNGSTLYFLGCTLAVLLFDRPEACAGILALALGDSSAAIVGSSVRSPRRGRVSLAGSLACLAVATLACRIFFPWPPALAAGAGAALLEAVSGSKADNLSIPIGVALLLHLL